MLAPPVLPEQTVSRNESVSFPPAAVFRVWNAVPRTRQLRTGAFTQRGVREIYPAAIPGGRVQKTNW